MSQTLRSTHSLQPPQSPTPSPRMGPAIELWRLRGAVVHLRGLAIETSVGYAFGLELDTELVLMHVQRTVESMVAYADRIESALIALGCRVVDAHPAGRSLHDVH